MTDMPQHWQNKAISLLTEWQNYVTFFCIVIYLARGLLYYLCPQVGQ